MQITDRQRAAIITTSAVAGAGAGVTLAHYSSPLDYKSVPSDAFVKEVAKEMSSNKAVNLLAAAGAQDYLDTIYATKNGVSQEQVDKFFNRYGDFLDIKREQCVDEKGKPLKGKALATKLKETVAAKIAENGEVSMSEDGKSISGKVNTTLEQAKELIKNGFKDRKPVTKANELISEEGIDILSRASKTIKNEKKLKYGAMAGFAGLVLSAIATWPKD